MLPQCRDPRAWIAFLLAIMPIRHSSGGKGSCVWELSFECGNFSLDFSTAVEGRRAAGATVTASSKPTQVVSWPVDIQVQVAAGYPSINLCSNFPCFPGSSPMSDDLSLISRYASFILILCLLGDALLTFSRSC